MLSKLENLVLTIETHLVSTPYEYEHAREPFAGVPSVFADWAELAMTNREAEAVFRAAITALAADPKTDPFLAARFVWIVPHAELSEAERALAGRIGAAHRAEAERAAAEALHRASVDELEAMDARRAQLEAEHAPAPPTEPADTGTTPKEPDPS